MQGQMDFVMVYTPAAEEKFVSEGRNYELAAQFIDCVASPGWQEVIRNFRRGGVRSPCTLQYLIRLRTGIGVWLNPPPQKKKSKLAHAPVSSL